MPVRFTCSRTSSIRLNLVATVLLALCLGVSVRTYAEGSKDLYPLGASGYRAYLNSTSVANSTNPFPTLGTVKVYVQAGETIYVGSSAQGVGNGTINLRAPNGNTFTTGNGSLLGVAVGRIYTRAQELAGPNPLSGGFTPATFAVTAAQAGVWEIDFVGPTNTSSANPTPVLANAAWTQPTNQNYIAAFDVSVRNSANTAFIPGRVYMNIFTAILGDFASGFNSVFTILTKDGFNYTVNNNGQAGNGFSFFVNNKGFRTSAGEPSYKSFNSLTNPLVQDPRADDTQTDITHKIFFTTPAADLPATAPGVGGSEWLRVIPSTPVISNITFNGVEGTANVAGTNPAGGNIGFTANQTGNFAVDLDLNSNGVYTDAADRRITGVATAGANSIYWDGLNGQGVKVGATSSTAANINIRVAMFGGEIHFPFLDVERNVNGIIITRTNGSGAGNNTVYWDDSNISPVVGTASNPIKTTIDGISSATNGHKWGTSGTGATDFGDVKGLDTWTYVLSNTLTNTANVVIKEADLQVVSVTPSLSAICQNQTITYTIPVKNNGPDSVAGARMFIYFPAELTNVTVSSAVTTGTATVSGGSASSAGYTSNMRMLNGAVVTYTVTGTMSSAPSGGSLSLRAAIMRPADVTDPDATNPDASAPADPQNECDSDPSGVGCNNIVTSTITSYALPSAANAGAAQTLCAATSTTLAGNTPASGTGAWTRVSGPNTPVFADASVGGTTVSGLTTGTYVFRWTISNGSCTASTSDVQVVVQAAIAGNTVTAPATVTFCGSGDAAVITGATPAGGSGVYTYQWQSSADGSSFTDISGATAASYDPPVATSTIYYRRGVSSGGCSTVVYSNVITIVIQPAVSSNTITAPAVTTFCASGDAAVINGSTPAGGSGTYTYQWQSSTDNTSFTAISGATSQSYDPPVAAVTTYYRRTVSSGACTTPAISNVITITVNSVLTAGSVGSDQSFCASGDPAAFTLLSAATGGTGTYTYQWQSSVTGSSAGFTDISGATLAVYDAPVVSQNTWYRRVVNSGTCAGATSNVVAVSVYSALSAGTIGAGQTFCASGDPAAFTQTAPSGGTGTYTYQWQSSADNTNFTNITGAIAATYDAPVTAQTTYYRRAVSSGVCTAVNSNVLTVTITPAVTNNTISGSQTICSGSAPAAFTGSTPANGTGTYTYLWESSTDGVNFITASGAGNGQQYTAGNLTQTGYYRRKVSSGVCSAVNSNIIQVTVNGASTGANAGPDQGPANVNSVTLAGNSPASGSGVWTQVAGPGTASIVNASQNNTVVNGLIPGVYTFRWTITNSPCAASSDDVDIRINSAPVARNDAAATNEDVALNIAVLANDTDADGTVDVSSVTIVNAPAHGAITVAANGVVTYTPVRDYNGSDNFTYTIKDNLGTVSAPASVNVTIVPVNDPPAAVNDQVNLSEDETITISAPGVLANDTDPDGEQLVVTLVKNTIHGTLSLSQKGAFTYTPNLDFNGLDSFVYRACDAANACATATVVLNVGNTNDAPVAAADSYILAEDGSLVIGNTGVLSNDTDSDGDVLSATLVNTVQHGTLTLNSNGSFTYIPASNYNGTDQFTYTACDASGACSSPVTVTLNVTAVNDKPVAQNNSYSVNEDQVLTVTARGVLLDDVDVDGDVLTAAVVTGPAHGTLVLNANGGFTYTPAADYNGADQFTYRACDGGSPQLCDTAVVSITVNPVNDVPVAASDAYTTAEDQPLSIAATGVLANDTDADGNPLTASLSVNAAHGTVSLQSNGSFLYTPDANYNGIDSFSYSVCDPSNACATGKVRITVSPVNDAPVVINASYVATEDQVLSVVAPGLIANGSDADGDVLTPSLVTQAQHGVVVINANGSFTYAPDADYNGSDMFTYRLCDPSGTCAQGTATITVNTVNDAPKAVNDSYSVAEDNTLSVIAANGVLANDTDVDGDRLTASLLTQPAHGTLTINSDGGFIYVPALNYNGVDSFRYRVCDGQNACDSGRVILTVTAVNDAPVAAADSYTLAEDGSLTIAAPGLLFNDTDVDGDPLTASPVSQPLHGTLTVNANGAFVYTPAANFNGLDSFTYRACDAGGLCSTATVTLSVTAVNDVPIVANDTYTTAEDIRLDITAPGILANDSDPDGDALTVSLIKQPVNGSLILQANGSFSYTPALNFNGRDSFDYRACDNMGACSATGTVYITVTPVNDAPVVSASVNYNTTEDIALNIAAPGLLLNASDPEGDAMTVALAVAPKHGAVTINANGSFSYIPAVDFNGVDTFTYRICDAANACSNGMAIITVAAENDAPVAVDDQLPATPEDVPVTIAAATLLANDSDVEGNPLTVSINSQPVNGRLVQNPDGSLTYTPALNYNGLDSFTYRVCDNGIPSLCTVATVRITVTAVNDAPVASDDFYTVAEDAVLAIAAPGVLFNDSDVDDLQNVLTASVVTAPGHGTVTVNTNGGFVYTPAANYYGADTLSYRVCDAAGACDTGLVVLSVTPVNDAPVTANDSYTLAEDTPLTITAVNGVLTNDADIDGDVLAAAVVTGPLHGTLVLNTDGSFSYTPDQDYNGIDSFSYRACDATGACTTGVVRLTVTAVNDAPATSPITYTVNEDASLILTNQQIVFNDTDADGDPLTVTAVTQPAHGTITANGNGTYTYSPAADFNGADSFTYTVSDGKGGTATGIVNITVVAVNDAPVAQSDAYTASEDQSFTSTVSVLLNDQDADGDALTASLLIQAVHGAVTLLANGNFTYEPVLNYNGLDSFTYVAADGRGGLDTAVVSITVTAVNDNPVAVTDTYTTREDVVLNVSAPGVLFNDSDPDFSVAGSGDVLTVVAETRSTDRGGVVQINSNGSFVYTPPANFNGADKFTYTLQDGKGGSATGTVDITVQSVNDVPVAVDDNYTVNEDVTLNVNAANGLLANDTDADGDALSASLLTPPAHGTVTVNANGSFSYTGNTNYNGPDEFTYVVRDGNGGADTGRVQLTVTAVDDPPLASDDNYYIATNGTLNIAAPGVLFNDVDVDSPLSAELVTGPSAGLTFNSDGSFVYVTPTGFAGTVTFSYRLCPVCTPATVTINVGTNNRPPQAAPDSYTTAEDVPLTVAAPGVLANDTDPDEPGTPRLSATLISTVSHGSLTLQANGSFVYVPEANYNGADNFTYAASDANGATSQTTVFLNVTAVNDAPVAADYNLSMDEDMQLNSSVATNTTDVDNAAGSLLYTVVANPVHGSLTLNANGTYTYTPAANYNGPDQFSYRVCDAGGLCDDATVAITVNAVNDAPVSQPDSYSVTEDVSLVVPAGTGVLANDVDVEGAPIVSLLANTVNGTLQLNPDGSFIYTPNANFTGTDQFTYQACDNGNPGLCGNPVTVTLTVTNVNDAPVGGNDSYTTAEDITLTIAAPGVLVNDSDADNDPLTAAVQTAPQHGSLTLNSDGSFVYTPAADYNGTDYFSYRISDGNGGSDTAQVTITITPVNDKPVANADTYAVTEDVPLVVNAAGGVLANDLDVDGEVIVAKLTDPSKGTLTLRADGSFTYVPLPDANGVDSFRYQACDINLCSDPVTVIFNIADVNDAPVAVADSVITAEDTPFTSTISVLANDTDADGTSGLTVNAVTTTDANGTLVMRVDGSYTYTPTLNFNGVAEYSYLVCDGVGLCDTGRLVIKVTPVNDAPVAAPDTYEVTEDVTLTVAAAEGVLANDVDVDGEAIVSLVSQPSQGALVLNANGSFTYAPLPNANGVDSFSYRACDLSGACSQEVKVYFNIRAVNDAPVINNDQATVAEDGFVDINVLANDADPDQGQVLTATVLIAPAYGTVTQNTDGSFRYTPAPNFTGTDYFTYQACDNNTSPACGSATVAITVTSVNDIPVAVADNYALNEDETLIIAAPGLLANDSDVDGDPLSVSIQTAPQHGTLTLNSDGSFTYVPNADYNGTDVFEYRVTDAAGAFAQAQVTLAIQPVNDVPLAVGDGPYTVAEDGVLTVPVAAGVLANDSDADGGTLTAAIATQPAHGTLTLNADGSFVYTPAPDYNGSDAFTYKVCDASSSCSEATVNLVIQPQPDRPVAADDNYTIEEDMALQVSAPGILNNDMDADGDVLRVSVVAAPVHGTLTLNADGGFVYVPQRDYNGLDSFTYAACDQGGLCANAKVRITITAVNDAPQAVNDNIPGTEDTPLVIRMSDLLANDNNPDGDVLTASITGQPQHGTLLLNNDGSYTYTPATDYNGTDQFVYTVCHNAVPALCNSATITVNIAAVNDIPVAVNDSYTTAEDTLLTVPAPGIIANDYDVDGDPLTVTVITTTTKGTVTLQPDGSFVYRPQADFNGRDSFVYRLCGPFGTCVNATARITVTPVNDAPVAVDDEFEVTEDMSITFRPDTVLYNDYDVDGDVIIPQRIGTLTHGTVVNNPDGTLTYTPERDFSGIDSIQYKLCDPYGLCDTAYVRVRVLPVNDAPVAVDDDYTTPEDTPLQVGIRDGLKNDYDPDGDELTPVLIEGPKNGTFVINPDKSYVYIPNPDFTGVDSIVYRVYDPLGAFARAVARVTVTPVNDAPVARDNIYVTDYNTPVSGNALDNDIDPDGDPLTASLVSTPVNGTVVFNANGTFTYAPAAGFSGNESFRYQVCDNGSPALCDIKLISITVRPRPNGAPVAQADNFAVAQDNVLSGTVLSNDTDPDFDPLTAAVVTQPANGTLVLNADGSFIYTPDTGFSGSDVFTYRACDNKSPALCSSPVTVSIIVVRANTPPVAGNDSYITNEDIALVVGSPGILSNDVNPGRSMDSLTITVLKNTSHGTTVLSTGGGFSYTPVVDYNGTDTLVYQICDAVNGCDTATVVIVVNAVNDLPDAAMDSYTGIQEDQPFTVNPASGVLANDTDREGGTLTASLVTPPVNGTLALNADGSFTYTPAVNYNGLDSFTYRVCDPSGGCTLAIARLSVTPVNDAPVTNPVSYTTNEDTPLELTAARIIFNDLDPDGDVLSIVSVSQPAHGTLTNNGNGTYTYTPAPDYNGQDSFTYTISDGKGGSATGTVNILVAPANDAPVSINDSYTLQEDQTFTTAVSVLVNDTDKDGDALTAILLTTTAHGTLSFNSDGSFVYQPDPDYNGADSFTYIADDGAGGRDTAVVNITITPVNDMPVANSDNYTTREDQVFTAAVPGVLFNDTDVDVITNAQGTADILSVLAETRATTSGGSVQLNANGTFVYTPPANFNGTDSFVYTLRDDKGGSATGTVVITVLSVNDAPVAANDSYTTNEDEAVTAPASVLLNDSDADGDMLTAAVLAAPRHGSVIMNADGTFVYVPNPEYSGTDSFTYTVSDNNGGRDTATVTITVLPVDDAPVAGSDNYYTPTNTTLTIAAPGVLFNDVDVDSELRAELVTAPDAATGVLTFNADGSFVFVPATGYSGTATFTYRLCTSCAPAVVTINVGTSNQPPIAVPDTYTIAEDQTLAITTPGVLLNDTDPNEPGIPALAAVLISPVSHGTLILNANGSFTYVPAADYAGTDSFVYEARDANGAAGRATVTINITPVNDAPVAVGDVVITDEDVSVTGNVLANDTDADDLPAALTVTLVQGAGHGTLTLNANGTYTYVPFTDYNGSDQFTYKVCDVAGACSEATVFVTVNAVNDAPVARPDAYTLAEDGQLVVSAAAGLLANDTDVDHEAIVSVLTTPASGTLRLLPDGSFTYTPNANFSGTDQFTYQACDNGTPKLCSAPVTVTLTVTAVNDAPVAAPDNYTTAEDQPLQIPAPGVLGNDTDADGDVLTAALQTGPAHGTVTLGPNGSLVYTPAADYHGADFFTYVVSDGKGGSSVAQVNITITPVNDLPKGNNDVYTLDEDATLVVNAANGVLGNDTDADGDPLVTRIEQAPKGKLVLNSDGSFVYTPVRDFNGLDSFTYRVCDLAGCSAPVKVILNVRAVNDPPVAVNDSAQTKEGGTFASTISVIANDSDADGNAGLAVRPVTITDYRGTLVLGTDGHYTYTPAPGFNGRAEYVYTLTDPTGLSATATLVITVEPVNHAPAAVNDAFTTPQNKAVSGNVLSNDRDADGNQLTASIVTPPASGTLVLNSNGSFTYTPVAGFAGIVSFIYRVCDNGTPVLCSNATVTITVTPVPLIGVAKALTASRKELDGSYTLTYTITVKNYGGAPLTNVQVTDNLSATFMSAANFTVRSVVSATGTLLANDLYNGRTVIDLLRSGSTLPVGATEIITFNVNVLPEQGGATYNNSVTVSAEGNGTTVTDVSTDGLNPDPDNNSDPAENVPTPAVLRTVAIKIPKGFSPNNDGINDYFVIENTGQSRISLEVYNRWGNLVYKNMDYRNNWDGRANQGIRTSDGVPDGTYFYIVMVDGKEKFVNYITINR